MVTTASTAEKLAAIRLKKCGGNLKKAFTWSSTKIKYFGGVKKPGKSKNAVEYYAAYGFKYGKGDCYVMAATFAMMAKVKGLNVKFVMGSVPQRNGKAALAAMKARGADWLALAVAVERPTAEQQADKRLQPAKRPAPQPPVAARPAKLSLTRIERLIRDPYAIYARYILRLQPLDPLHQIPDARDRGVVVHEVLERFVKTRPRSESRAEARNRLLQIARDVLAQETPFPAARTLWLAKLDRAADHFLAQDGKHGGTALAVETVGSLKLDNLDFTLFGTPDRIDRLPDGSLHLIDYKTGAPPSVAEQKHFAKQLLLAAAMAERGGFTDLGPSDVSKISYIGLGAGEKAVETDTTPEMLAADWAKLNTLISRYLTRATGYVARRAIFDTRFPGDYDHLARFGEWQMSDRAFPEIVGPEDAA